MKHYFLIKSFKVPLAVKCSTLNLLPKRVRVTAWANILLQLLFPLSLSFTPAIAAAPKPKTITISTATEPYILGVGESVDTVAKKHGISVDELKRINIYRTFSKPFAALTDGDEIDIPSKVSPFSIDNEKNRNTDIFQENKLASHVQIGATALATNNAAKSSERIIRSTANNEFNSSAQQWLSQFGTARVQMNVNDDFKLDGSAVDMLVPIYDNQKSILFTQLGARNKDSRNTVNIGAGVRVFQNNWMYGVNTFFDNDMIGKNRRVGVGAEAWTDYLKLSANSYFGTTDWHQSRDFADYNERPANGYDVRAEAYLPSHPQLGGKLMYEKYRGEEVALFGKDNRQKNPHAVTAGVNYTPIPLLTVGAEHRAGKGSKNDSSINFQFNYRLGESWQSHINPSTVAAIRTLAGSRNDLVERNNNIVLDYQKQELIRLSLPERVEGKAGDIATVNAQVTSKYGLERIDWDSAALIAAGGTLSKGSSNSISITLPPYQASAGNTPNSYTLSAIAFDTQGNRSNSSSTLINVSPQNLSTGNSLITTTPSILVADGVSTSQITITLRDSHNQPVIGASRNIILASNFVADGSTSPIRAAAVSEMKISDVSEAMGGVYNAILTAGTQPGTATITPSINGMALNAVNVIFTTNAATFVVDSLTADTHTTFADGNNLITFTATVKDSSGHGVSNTDVILNTTGGVLSASSVTTDTNGVATFTLKSTNTGSFNVTAKSAVNTTDIGQTQNVTFIPVFTGIIAGGYSFNLNEGFPKTGFNQATFTINMNGTADYNWSSNQPAAVTVNSSGQVTFNGPPSGTVTITATPNDGGSPQSYSFTVENWFEGDSTSRNWGNANSYCSGRSEVLPTIAQLTSGGYIRQIGSLFGEWGNMMDYGFPAANNWSSEQSGTSNYYYYVVGSSGGNSSLALYTPGGTSVINKSLCVRDL